MRCISCNSVMLENAYSRLKKNGDIEDLCTLCLEIAKNPDDVDSKEYQFENLTRGNVGFFKLHDIDS